MAYNNHQSRVIKETPFFANHERHPNLFGESKEGLNTKKAETKIDDLKTTYKQIRERIKKSQLQTDQWNNKQRQNEPQPKKEDKIYLKTTNLKTKRFNKSLNHAKVGSFEIDEVVGPVNYRLRLSGKVKIHPVFHMSLIEPADKDTPLQISFNYKPEQDDEYEAEKILDQRQH